MEIPCGTCIALAACVAKKDIECEIIYDMLRREVTFDRDLVSFGIRQDLPLGSIREDLRDQINQIFPNVRYVTILSNGHPKLIFKGFKR